MKGRSAWWFAAAVVVSVVLKEVTCTAGEGNAGKDKKFTRSTAKQEEDSDLETSETTYYNSYINPNNYRSTYNPFVHTLQTSVTYLPNLVPKSFQYFGQSFGNSVHQEIRCGDTYPRQCQKSRYRSYDGSCNNLHNPTWGMANTRYGRLLPANYADGKQAPTSSVTGEELPLARMVSYTLFPHADIDDPKWTLAAMQWGQIITHDMGLIDGTTQSKAHATMCCTEDGQLLEPPLLDQQCYPMVIPHDDPVYSHSNTRCLTFVRSTTDISHGCSSQHKAAEQLTIVTHFLDCSIVYGSSDQTAAGLRAGVGGRLNVDVRHHREWLPSATNKSGVCDNSYPHETCYQAGDTRVNQNPQLTVLQIILHREHNRIADILAHINPHWTDETIYQEARRILIAEHQHISYYEWLPIFLGYRDTYGHNILYDTKDYVNDYDPHQDPSILNEHSTAAFRYFHSMIAGHLDLVDEHRYVSPYNSLRLSDHFNRPSVIEEGNNMDDLTRGLSCQPQKAGDPYFDKEITQYLFRNDKRLGSDLRATDIQRNRDHGLASYNHFREYCGLPRARHFTDFLDYISPENVQKLSQLYHSPDDVDLTVGGSLERHVEGALSGPTFLCILVKQFYRTRVGDRYWYERGDHELGFTIEQLGEIRKASISRLFCDNGDHILAMQPKGFQKISQKNSVTSCDHLPAIDFSYWKDYAPEISGHQHTGGPHFKKR